MGEKYWHKYEKGIQFINETGNQRIFSDPLHTFYLLVTCLENYCNKNIRHKSWTHCSQQLMYQVIYKDTLITMEVGDNDEIKLIKKSQTDEGEATLSDIMELFQEIPETIFVNALLLEVPIEPLRPVEKHFENIKINFGTSSSILVPENKLSRYSETYLNLMEKDKVINVPVVCNQSLANKIGELILTGEMDTIHNTMTKSYSNLEIFIDILNYLGIHF